MKYEVYYRTSFGYITHLAYTYNADEAETIAEYYRDLYEPSSVGVRTVKEKI